VGVFPGLKPGGGGTKGGKEKPLKKDDALTSFGKGRVKSGGSSGRERVGPKEKKSREKKKGIRLARGRSLKNHPSGKKCRGGRGTGEGKYPRDPHLGLGRKKNSSLKF